MQEEGLAGLGAAVGEEGAQVPVQGRRDHAATATMPRRPLLSHGLALPGDSPEPRRPVPSNSALPGRTFPVLRGWSLSCFFT